MDRKLPTVTASAEGFSAAAANNIASGSLTPSGNDRVLFAFVGCSSASPAFATECRWGGATGDRMDQVFSTATLGSGFCRLQIFRLVNPQSKADTARAQWAASQDERWIVVVAVQDVDLANNIGEVALARAGAVSTDPTVNAVSENGALVLDHAFANASTSDAGCTIVADGSQTSLQEQEGSDIGGFTVAGTSSKNAVGASTTMAWDVTHSGGAWDWVHVAFAVFGADARPKGRMGLAPVASTEDEGHFSELDARSWYRVSSGLLVPA